jgi:CheY-like chemotaxis protein
MRDFFILAVEDDADDVLLLELAFKRIGLGGVVHFVSDGKEAMNYLLGTAPFDNRRKHPFPNLLLVDLMMPGVDGFELLDWLRAHPFPDSKLKVAVLTGSCRQQDLERGHTLGADICLNKLTDLQGLVAAIKNMVEETHLQCSDSN